MISRVIVTNCIDAPIIVDKLKTDGKNVCWISIANRSRNDTPPSVSKSSKHVLVSRFDDTKIDLSNKQAKKIKDFIMNHHINNVDDFVLVINCIAGLSRSPGVAMFCMHNLGIPVTFTESDIFPNQRVMQLLGVPKQHHATIIIPS